MRVLRTTTAISIISFAYVANWLVELITTGQLPARIDEAGD